MNQKRPYKIFFVALLLIFSLSFSQTKGDLAFVGFNSDGDDDFSVVTLVDLAINSTIYIKDGSGFITWNTGNSVIKAGSIVTFTDVDGISNPFLGVTIGSISKSGTFNWSASGEAIFMYVGTDKDTPTTYITGIKNGTISTELLGTGLTIAVDFLEINNTASPNGGYFSGSRNNKATFAEYLSVIVDNSKWTRETSAGENVLPFSGELFSLTGTTINTWTGATNSVWNFAGNWSAGIPTATSIVTIPNVANSPIINSGSTAFAGNLIIETGEHLTINALNSLTVSGLLTISGSLTVESGGSIIINGSASGNYTYNVNVTDTNWHLISSPVNGEQYDDSWNTTNSINVSGTGLNDAVSTYDNTVATGNWKYFQTGGMATTFNSGQGYSLKRTSSGNYSFIGTFPNNNVSPVISQNSNNWNLIGNPFPSYIDITTFISTNTSNLPGAFQSIYVWNAGTSSYNALTAGKIHVGQAFFINSNVANGNASIAKSNVSHQTGITFYKTSSPNISISVTDNILTKSTEINYLTGKTTGLNPGYDIGMFNGVSSDLDIYSHLVNESEGIAFMRQALPDNDYENLIIPIGLDAASGKNLTFSVDHQNLPIGLMVFLEDKKTKTITRLDENNNNYKTILDDDINGIGRFFLRTSTTDLRKTLNIEDLNIDQINMYVTSKRSLIITGFNGIINNIKIYNIIGKQVFNMNLQKHSTINIPLNNTLKKGMYIIKLETEKRSVTKKIFLE